MKLFTRTSATTNRAAAGQGEESFDVPAGTITWLSIIYLVVSSAATYIGNYFNDKPKNEIASQTIGLKEQNFKLQLLQRILEEPALDDRKKAAQLFVRYGFFDGTDDKRGLLEFVDTSKYIPRLTARPLEQLNSYLITPVATQDSADNKTTSRRLGNSTKSDTNKTTTPARGDERSGR
jgi:hypothetical protein